MMDKETKRAYDRAWYAKMSEERKAHKYDVQKKRRIELSEWFAEFKLTLKCSKCSESHIACLDFHHAESSKKESTVANAISGGWSKERVMREVEKCIVLCSNCHRKMHYDERRTKETPEGEFRIQSRETM